jgi:hypothetical protein
MSEPLIQENFRVESITVKVSDPNNPENKIKTYLDKDSVSQFEYREGLLDKFLKVTLQIADSNSALSDKLVGMEQFEVVVHDLAHDVKYEFTEESINGPLYVFQIHDKIIVDSVKILVLELCRKDAIEGMQIRVCKKYTSVKAEELAEDILKNVLNTKKPYTNVSKSSNTLTFIPPNSRPYDVLFWSKNKYFAGDQKSTATGGGYASAGYLFWETYDQYNFKSIDSLAGQTEEKQVYTTGTGVGGNDEYYKIRDPSFPKSLDMMTDFDRGFYSGTIEFFDVVNCEYKEEPYTLKENFSKWKTVTGNSTLPSLYSDVLDKGYTRTMALSYNDDLFLEPEGETTNSKMLFKETVTQSVQRMGVFTSQIMQGRVYGNMRLNAGDIINVEFLGADGGLDKNYSGRYVIFDVLHIYSKGDEIKLKTDLTLVRDSFGV